MAEAGDDQVCIRVMAAGVNPSETKLHARVVPDLNLPAILGDDLAGTIDVCGAGFSAFELGAKPLLLEDCRHLRF